LINSSPQAEGFAAHARISVFENRKLHLPCGQRALLRRLMSCWRGVDWWRGTKKRWRFADDVGAWGFWRVNPETKGSSMRVN